MRTLEQIEADEKRRRARPKRFKQFLNGFLALLEAALITCGALFCLLKLFRLVDRDTHTTILPEKSLASRIKQLETWKSVVEKLKIRSEFLKKELSITDEGAIRMSGNLPVFWFRSKTYGNLYLHTVAVDSRAMIFVSRRDDTDEESWSSDKIDRWLPNRWDFENHRQALDGNISHWGTHYLGDDAFHEVWKEWDSGNGRSGAVPD